jgi:hypothetical protein
MKTRMLWCALAVGVMSLSSGCYCFHQVFPNVGWRFHQGCCAPACGPVCGPVCSPCCSSPVVYRPPVVTGGPIVPGGPPCATCANGDLPPGAQPVGYPPVAYPPIIGNPMPLPGASGVPNNELHSPMPVKKNGQ